MATSKKKKLQPVSPEWEAFGARIKEQRKRCKLTRPELAELMGTSRMTVFRVEIGNTRVPLERIKDWASALKTNASSLTKLVLL